MHSLLIELRENLASSMAKQRKVWANELAEDEVLLKECLFLLDEEYRTASRFVWLLGDMVERHPEAVIPHLPFLWKKLPQLNIPDTERSMARYFNYCGIPEEMEGEVIDTLFHWLNTPETSKACRYQTMHVLAAAVKKYPELAGEFRDAVQSQMPEQNHVFRHYAYKILKQLEAY